MVASVFVGTSVGVLLINEREIFCLVQPRSAHGIASAS